MLRKISLLFLFFFVPVVVWVLISGSGYVLYPFGHLSILLGWVFVIWKYKLAAGVSMRLGLILFFITLFFSLLGLKVIAEEFARAFFIIFALGIFQAFWEKND